MTSYKQTRKCTQYVFSNKSVVQLIEDILEWTKKIPHRKAELDLLLESLSIEYCDEKGGYYNCLIFVANE